MKSCFPDPALDPPPPKSTHLLHRRPISSLPDDLLLECLSRVPSSSLHSISLVCRRWSHLLRSPSFLYLRRLHNLLRPTLFAFSSSHSALFSASLLFHPPPLSSSWNLDASSLPFHFSFSPDIFTHSRLVAIGHKIYILGRTHTLCYDVWTDTIFSTSSMLSPRKKFASAAVSGKIYVAGGGGSSHVSAVEEYDPDSDTWCVVSQSPRRRYGCVGAAVDGVFYVIGGLKIGPGGGAELTTTRPGAEAYAYASSMDLYDVEARGWLRSRSVPGGGCVVAACAAGGFVYILGSHAVELSFWRFDGRRKGKEGGAGFGEWCRIKSPPVPQQMRVDGTVRFCCVGVEEKVVVIQVIGSIDDLLRRSGRNVRGMKEALVLVYDPAGGGEWSRGPDLPEVIRRAACVTVEC
ncbi:F-box/kelch-repeat protein At5g26960 [Linum perenne]